MGVMGYCVITGRVIVFFGTQYSSRLVYFIWQPKAGLAYNVIYTMLYSYTKQNQQLETNSKPRENEFKNME